MNHYLWISVLLMGATTVAIRVLPLTLIRKQIKNRFLRSFLTYVPYVTLAVMTFPAILEATAFPLAGVIALLVGVVFAWLGASLLQVASLCCLSVLLAEWLLPFLF